MENSFKLIFWIIAMYFGYLFLNKPIINTFLYKSMMLKIDRRQNDFNGKR